MKFLTLVILLVQLGTAPTVKAMNERSKSIIKRYLLEYQASIEIPCTLHYLDTFIDLGLFDNNNFQVKIGTLVGKLGSTCNIFICSSDFSQSKESKEIDKLMKNHMWIIDGNYPKKHFVWPVVEVAPKISKLFCPKDPVPKLVSGLNIQFCPEYPTFKGQPMKVAMFGAPPTAFPGPDGSLMGIDPDTILLLMEYVEFYPMFVFPRSYDETVFMVHNGSVELGVDVIITPNRYKLIDFSSYLEYTALTYSIRVPQPVDVLYQFLQPFEMMVWITWFSMVAIFGILIYVVTYFTKSKISKLALPNVKLIDYVLYSIGITIQPLIDHQWINIIRSKTWSGTLIILGLSIAGFLVMNVYKTDLLSSLTAISFEKPIDTVKDLLEKDIKVYHYADETYYLLKDHPRKEYRELYQKVTDRGWIITDIAQIPLVIKSTYDGEGSFMSPDFTFHFFMTNDIKEGKGSLVRHTKEIYRSDPSCLTLPKNGPMTRTFDKFILRGVDHGLFQRIRNKYQLKLGKNS